MDQAVRRYLYSAIEPYETGFLDTDQPHRLYWEQCGKKDGIPVVFLHGGPGAGISVGHRRFFDPEFYRMVLFDQRGSGRSHPYASVEDNTTQALIRDIEALRRHLGIDRWIVFGGSWGSSLALAYAEAFPENCLALVLRGIFLCRQSEVDWFLNGMGQFFPEARKRFVDFLPLEEREDILGSYYRRLVDENPEVHLPAAVSWSRYEAECSMLIPQPDNVDAQPEEALSLARIEAHYFVNRLFLEEGQLLRDLDGIRHLPCIIVQGRYDVVCPPRSAFDLKAAWPAAELNVVKDAGHSATEPGISAELVAAMERLKGRFL